MTADEEARDRQRHAAHARVGRAADATISVVRARREFANQSSLGFIATATDRHLD